VFGGLALLVGGNMSVGASGQGGLMVRVDPGRLELDSPAGQGTRVRVKIPCVIDSIDEQCLARLAEAVAGARARAWELGARPERVGLVAQRAEIGEAVPTVGQRHDQIVHHAPRVMRGATLPRRRHRRRQRRRQPHPVGRPRQQRATSVAHLAAAVRRYD
jgi:hypothetical protein